MIRLAVVAPHFPEYSLRYAAAMAKYCDVLACIDKAQLATEYDGRKVDFGRTRLEPVNFKTPNDLLKMCAAIKKFRPDVVHIQEAVGPRRAFFTVAIARLMKSNAAIVLSIHDPLPHEGSDEAAARRTAWIGSHVRRAADLVVVHGAYCAGLIESSLEPDQQLAISEHGVILVPPDRQPPPDAPLKLYAFGRMEKYKGVEVLLRTAEILHAEAFPFQLKVAGRGPELDRLQRRFAALPEVEVQNAFIAPNEIMASIQAAECIVLPYLSATQSGVLAAAYAGHRYVIASNTGGLHDVVKDGINGVLVPPGDAAALAGAVRTIAKDAGLRKRLQAGAVETASGQLDWDRIARDLMVRFEAVVAIRSR